jgi:hypothetical protein
MSVTLPLCGSNNEHANAAAAAAINERDPAALRQQ